ncbi:MAG TPA: carotenoid oxygenase family protein [Solirubrobacterales bacterium]|jgi:carotenoid cleavage dioxygenase-like enzyme|nr:carotenoid oxygenase family protein [Solirubrobacterales bacterium]
MAGRSQRQPAPQPGYHAGFATLDSEVELDRLDCEGAIPEWLTGTLLRNGPARFEVGQRQIDHWFDGLAMLHRFSFAAGRVSYANRFLRSEAFRQAEAGRLPYAGFATDPCRSLFKRLTTLFRPGFTDNCNIQLAKLGEEYIAMTETPLPIAFDPETLDAFGVAYRPPGMHATAHPHRDRKRDELIAYTTQFGRRCEYRLYAQRDRFRQRPLGAMEVAEPSYMHSFALTERYAVLVAFPLVVNPLRLAAGILAGRHFIENYRWKLEQGTRILVFDRGGGGLWREFEAAPRFAFHHVNAFERDGELVLDLVAYEDAAIVLDLDALHLDRLRKGSAQPPLPQLLRYRVSTSTGAVSEEPLSDVSLELPRIDYEQRNTHPYRYVYGVGAHRREGPPEFLNQLVKLDVESGEARRWHEPGSYPGEPIFVRRPGDEHEDGGVLLSVVLEGGSDCSYLLVLDAATMEEVGRARVPHHVPFGFHGEYFA